MRNAFVSELLKLAKEDNKIILIVGDLGYGVVDKFSEELPQQFINAGISEQNMASVAAGLAISGFKPYIYSIANFPSVRAMEQIRNDIAYPNLNVKIVSIGAGFAYGTAGMSHHATEDLAMMKAIPNMSIFTPGDAIDAVAVAKFTHLSNSPCYIRLGKGHETLLSEEQEATNVLNGRHICSGNDICLLSTGAISSEAKDACQILNKKGISSELIEYVTNKPLNKKEIETLCKKYKLIITVEEGTIQGGFGSSVCEIAAQNDSNKAKIVMMGLDNQFASVVGSQKYIREKYQLDAESIALKCIEEYRK